ncbi:hypothetical protein ASPCADRAFT_508690 [Aspergillus carbonarius ITEM 5010]|uniref:Uncharacterized protein n=1 Tax=Aspergillus carbonarius (strain ITEM 5010) TaxID=602072 RepID=A0A1R3RGI1_ASPC5|nr:hypothetical protein ASPCADRAFT_508690 [Aspergillus carbonarius ITEM 5010]
MSEEHSIPGFQDVDMLETATTTTMTPIRTFKYEGLSDFTSLIHDNLYKDIEILEFLGVSADDFSILSLDEARPLKSARFSYDSSTSIMQVRMPHYRHELVNGLFRTLIDKQLMSMNVENELFFLSAPLTVIGSWTKEPDACWVPDNTKKPSVVQEVGSSETAAHLTISARAWIEISGSSVLACITIKIRPDNDLVIDVWKRGERTYNLTSRNAHTPAIRQQHIQITNTMSGPQVQGWKVNSDSSVVPTDEILLEFSLFVGRPANNDLEHDIRLDRSILIQFATRFFTAGS